MKLLISLLVVLLLFGRIAPAAAATSDLDGLTGWYKSADLIMVKAYSGVFDQKETCLVTIKSNSPLVTCVRLVVSEGAGGWWIVDRKGTSVTLIGPYRSEDACKQGTGLSGRCRQAQVKQEGQ